MTAPTPPAVTDGRAVTRSTVVTHVEADVRMGARAAVTGGGVLELGDDPSRIVLHLANRAAAERLHQATALLLQEIDRHDGQLARRTLQAVPDA